MAPLGSPDSPQSRFRSGFSSTSMAPMPSSGFAFDVPSHLQRLVQSSASSNEEATFQIPQQVPQYYLQRRQQASQNGGSTVPLDIHRVSDDGDSMVAELPKQDPQLGQALQSFMQENMSAGVAPSLMRYNSAPSSMLASLTGMGNGVLKHDAERGQFLPNNDLRLESKKLMDPAHEPLRIDSRGAAGAVSGASVDNVSNHRSGLLSSYSPYRRPFDNNNGELLSQMGMDVEGASLIRAPDGLPEGSRAALDMTSSYQLRGAFAANSTHLENGNGIAHGVAASKNCLLRHSSSPAGFLSQLNDDHERHMLGSSSGNSSEEGSYERQGGQGFLGKFSWDEAGNAVVGSPSASYAARKRTRDLEEKGYGLMESQKGDALEHGVLGNYFGLPSTTSPENTYFTDKLSPDSIPCRTRAKRGCATHPRSIAERVRRTKISERMKKLQDLVPNMDKQTNTAEMLDEAVEYVKHLQRQVQELTESRSKCECSCKPKETSSK